MRGKRSFLVALGTAVVAVGAGCGNHSSPHVASLHRTSTSAAKTAAEGSKKDPYAAVVDYVNCMRGKGFQLPDPKPNGDINLSPAEEAQIRRAHPEGMMSADKQCFHFLRGAVKTKPLSSQAKTRVADVMLGFARCMRRHGYQLGDPVITDLPRGEMMIGFPHTSAETQAAQRTARYRGFQRECEKGQAARLKKAMGNER